MLWNLLDGKAYTATELALAADISSTSASNHLSKLLEADLLKVEAQGRHRYYAFARPEVAYVIESMANLSNKTTHANKEDKQDVAGIKYCRSCYDHLAGQVGVRITEALETKKLIRKFNREYTITGKGWQWLLQLDIHNEHIENGRRSLARQCLDWSERKPHIAGQIGALLMQKMFERNWLRKMQFSRELIITSKGKKKIYELLGIQL